MAYGGLGFETIRAVGKNSTVPVGADDELILRIGFCGVASGGEGNDDFDLRA